MGELVVLEKLNKWTFDMLKKSTHKAQVIIEEPKWKFSCFKCTGEWIMSDSKDMQPIFDRGYISCPHCRKKAKPEKMGM